MEVTEYSFRLINIELISSSLYNKPTEFSDELFHFQITAESRVLPDKKIIFSVVTIDINEKNNVNKVGSIETALAFEIQDFDNLILFQSETNKFLIPPELENMLRNVAISTTRGIMFGQFRGTHLHKAILPILSGMDRVFL